LIIPAHNEEKRLGRCLRRTLDYFSVSNLDFEIIVAEDGSTDRTKEIVLKFSEESDRVKLISSNERSGKGGGIKRAIGCAHGKVVGYMDADLSAGPEELSRLLDYMDAFDVVIGSRLLRGDLPPITRPLSRSVLSNGYSTLFRIMFRTGIRDPQCGLKLFKREVINEISALARTYGFAFDSEILIWASKLGYRIKEVPINWSHQEGSKVLPPIQIMAMSKDLVSIWRRVQTSTQLYPKLPPLPIADVGVLDVNSHLAVNLAEQRIN